MPPSAKEASSAPSSLRTVTRAFWTCRQEAGGRDAVNHQVGRGGDAAAVLEGGDAVVDGRHRGAQGVEGGDQGVAPVALAFGPAVAAELQGRAVPQDWLGREGSLAQEVANDHGSELGLDQTEDAATFGPWRVREVPGIEGAQVGSGQVPRVALPLRVAVAGDLQGAAVAEDAGPGERRLEQQVLDDRREELVLHDLMNGAAGGAGRAHQVAGVPRGLVQEARAGDGVVDLRLGAPRRPVLG